MNAKIETKVVINSIDKVKQFVNDISKFDADFILQSGRYVIDAKSIMGVFSLDLTKPIDLIVEYNDEICNKEDIEKAYEKFLV